MSPSTRKALYKLSAAVIAIVGMYFGVSAEVQDLWLALSAQVIAVATIVYADKNTSKDDAISDE